MHESSHTSYKVPLNRLAYEFKLQFQKPVFKSDDLLEMNGILVEEATPRLY